MLAFFYLLACAALALARAAVTPGHYKGDAVSIALGYELRDLKVTIRHDSTLSLSIHSSFGSVNCHYKDHYQAFEESGDRLILTDTKNANCVLRSARRTGVVVRSVTFTPDTILLRVEKKMTFFWTISRTITLRLQDNHTR
jgi:hypothetical protein